MNGVYDGTGYVRRVSHATQSQRTTRGLGGRSLVAPRTVHVQRDLHTPCTLSDPCRNPNTRTLGPTRLPDTSHRT